MAETVHDEVAIRYVMDEYAVRCDDRDHEALALLFAQDGVITIAARDATGDTADDPAATVLTWLSEFRSTFHVVANHAVAVNGEDALGSCYMVIHRLREDGDRFTDEIVYARSQDRLSRRGGRWQFVSRDMRIQWHDQIDAMLQRFGA